jgi:hypothetical protein
VACALLYRGDVVPQKDVNAAVAVIKNETHYSIRRLVPDGLQTWYLQ